MQAATQAKYKTNNEFTDTQLLKTSIYDVADRYIPYSSYVSTPECYVFKHNKKKMMLIRCFIFLLFFSRRMKVGKIQFNECDDKVI